MTEPITTLAAAVAAAGALPMPVGTERGRLRAAYIEALDNAHETHPCPATGRPYWLGCVHYDDAGRMVGVGSCHEERRADAVLAVRDVELERLRARVAELEAERHSAEAGCTCPPAPRPHQVGCPLDGVRSSAERPVNGLTATFMPLAVLREVPDGEHYAATHHDYRVGHDLPETGGAK